MSARLCKKGLHLLSGKNLKFNDGADGVVFQCRECKNAWKRKWSKSKKTEQSR